MDTNTSASCISRITYNPNEVLVMPTQGLIWVALINDFVKSNDYGITYYVDNHDCNQV